MLIGQLGSCSGGSREVRNLVPALKQEGKKSYEILRNMLIIFNKLIAKLLLVNCQFEIIYLIVFIIY